MTDLVLILGDQLSPALSSLSASQPGSAEILMAEVWDEARYAPHHKQKLAFIFSAMRHFASELEADGWTVHYRRLDEDTPAQSLFEAVRDQLERGDYRRLVLTEPGEWRLVEEARSWSKRLGIEAIIAADDRFLASHDDFESWAEGRKQFRMEYFYREMRRRSGLLMDGAQPAGGKWNYDAENRKPAAPDMVMPAPFRAEPDAMTLDVLAMVERLCPHAFGTLDRFGFAVTRAGAQSACDHFMRHALPSFGDYQDAMLSGSPFLFHSILSGYINVGLLDPMAVCQAAEAEYEAGRAPLNAAEGFIRQILGWREYIRGIYWLQGPDYVHENALGATRDLPDFYWSGETGMACLAAAIGQTRDHAYAHHIQRLMVTGTFAMLAGVDPHQVHEWYLGVYIDAFEWVEAPNVIGMSQFADGGVVASKPYAASGAYIDRMSDYCSTCRYSVKDKTSPNSCPFNSLYWDFLDRNAETLRGNPRLGPVYRTWDRMTDEKQAAYRDRASDVLADLDRL